MAGFLLALGASALLVDSEEARHACLGETPAPSRWPAVQPDPPRGPWNPGCAA